MSNHRPNAGLAIARLLMNRPAPAAPAVKDKHEHTMPGVSCCLCGGEAVPATATEFRFKIRGAANGTRKILLVCQGCARTLPGNHAAATEVVLRAVGADAGGHTRHPGMEFVRKWG